jgi:hypothetical protein
MSPARLEEEHPPNLFSVCLARASISSGGSHQDTARAGRDISKTVLVLGTLFVLFGASGCRTSRLLPPANLSEAGWHVRQGQSVWRSKAGAPEIAGELLVATRADGRVFLQFTKTPLPFVVAQIADDAWQIEFIVENKVFSGPGRPPSRLGWLQLARCLAALPPPGRWRWEKLDGERWRLENKSTGESFEGFLAP